MLRKSLLVALLAASLGSISVPATARAEVDVILNFGPPAVRHEVVPAPRPGYVWAPGYWDVRGHKHVWRQGHWERVRPGQTWHESRWVQRPNGWYLERVGAGAATPIATAFPIGAIAILTTPIGAEPATSQHGEGAEPMQELPARLVVRPSRCEPGSQHEDRLPLHKQHQSPYVAMPA